MSTFLDLQQETYFGMYDGMTQRERALVSANNTSRFTHDVWLALILNPD